MLTAYKKLILGCLILLLVPVAAIIMNFKWDPAIFENNFQFIYVLTESASSPWALITCFIFLVIFIYLLSPLTRKQIIQLTIILALSVLVGQGIKTVVKTLLAEPRPFVVWLGERYQIDTKDFYKLSRKDRAAVVEKNLQDEPAIPSWMRYHWKNETGYSRPSGHALFSACWALLFLCFFNFRKHYIIISLAMIWAVIIATSRLVLGMHWELDLITGIIVAGIVAAGTLYAANRMSLLPDNEKSKPIR